MRWKGFLSLFYLLLCAIFLFDIISEVSAQFYRNDTEVARTGRFKAKDDRKVIRLDSGSGPSSNYNICYINIMFYVYNIICFLCSGARRTIEERHPEWSRVDGPPCQPRFLSSSSSLLFFLVLALQKGFQNDKIL